MADTPLPVCPPFAEVRGIVVNKERGKTDKYNEHPPASQLLLQGLLIQSQKSPLATAKDPP